MCMHMYVHMGESVCDEGRQLDIVAVSLGSGLIQRFEVDSLVPSWNLPNAKLSMTFAGDGILHNQ